jgi:hypothetical protein
MGSEVARVLGVTNVMSSLLLFFGLLSSLEGHPSHDWSGSSSIPWSALVR